MAFRGRSGWPTEYERKQDTWKMGAPALAAVRDTVAARNVAFCSAVECNESVSLSPRGSPRTRRPHTKKDLVE